MEIESGDENKQVNQLPLVQLLTARAKPGQFGNLYSYYTRKRANPWEDERLASLPEGIFAGKKVLYIGCHEGAIPIQIALKYGAKHVTAIDIDPKLILKAVQNAMLVDKIRMMSNKELDQYHFDFLSHADHPFYHGFLSSRRKDHIKSPIFDLVDFQRQNILDIKGDLKYERFDVICCFKVTKYIHLNFGDAGILRLFKVVQDMLDTNGLFLLNAQTQRSYAKMKSFCPEFTKNYNEIQIWPDQFPERLTRSDLEFNLVQGYEGKRSGSKSKSRKSKAQPEEEHEKSRVVIYQRY